MKNRKPIKNRNPIAVALSKRTGSFAGYHGNKVMRGSGKGKGKVGRYPKHKNRSYS